MLIYAKHAARKRPKRRPRAGETDRENSSRTKIKLTHDGDKDAYTGKHSSANISLSMLILDQQGKCTSDGYRTMIDYFDSDCRRRNATRNGPNVIDARNDVYNANMQP
jgi:hypothetical protein